MGTVKQRGFTLTELLVALAILGALGAALMQSIVQTALVSERIESAVNRALRASLQSRQMQDVIHGLTPGWPERPDEVFIGAENSFSGLTKRPLLTTPAELLKVSVRIEDTANNDTLLTYVEDARAFKIPIEESSALSLRFEYRGSDNRWRSRWPSGDPISPFFETDAEYARTEQLPNAVRLIGDEIYWIAAIPSSSQLPFRVQDFE